MKKEEVNAISTQWVAQASKDVREKIKSFAESCSIEPLAMHAYFDLTRDELSEVLNGTKTPSLELFSKIMVLTNNTIAVVPIEDVEEDAQAPQYERDGSFFHRRDDSRLNKPTPRHTFGCCDDEPYGSSKPNRIPFGSNNHPLPNFRHIPPPPPPHHFMRNIPIGDGCAKMNHGSNDEHTSKDVDYCKPFRTMPRSKLVDIIYKKHWDSEINLLNSTFNDLVEFLGKKNEGIIKNKKIEKAENGNLELMKFVDSLKQLTKNNPQIKEMVKSLVNDF